MALSSIPNEALALKVLPKPLRLAIQATFGKDLPGCALVGGTALAGFYAGHRESADMDLFTADATAQAMTVAAVKALPKLGASLLDERHSPAFYHSLIQLDGHDFTADVVLDANIHRIGKFALTSTGIRIGTPDTILMMKIATLVSRCSEKDLFDLLWLNQHYAFDIEKWVALGQQVDGGVNAESLLISLTAVKLRKDACGFAVKFGVSATEVLQRITAFKIDLQKKLAQHLERRPPSPAIAPLLRAIRKLKS